MAKIKVKQLTMTGFRGATGTTTIEFDPSKYITMIFGENGTGKSSIADAFSYLCDGDYGSLSDRSGVDKSFIASIGSNIYNLRVKLKTETGEWLARFRGKAPETTPREGCPSVQILRRSQIMKLIDAQPKQRYEALENYIDVFGVQQCENSLREATKIAKEEFDRSVSAYTSAIDTLTALWHDAGKPGLDAISWVEMEAAKDLNDLQLILSVITTLTTILRDSKNELIVYNSAKIRTKEAEELVITAENIEKGEADRFVIQSQELLLLLQKAKIYVDAIGDIDRCPICQQSVDRESLSTELNKRIAEMDSLAKVMRDAESRRKAFEAAKIQLATAEARALGTFSALAKEVAASSLDLIRKEEKLLSLTMMVPDTSISQDERFETAKTLVDFLNSILPALDDYRSSAERSIHLQKTIQTQLKEIMRHKQRAQETESLVGRLTEALSVLETTRKKFISQVLRDISQEVEQLYRKLHPGEGVGGIKLTLDQKYIGSLHLQGEFYTAKDITPQSVFSESHLDTLGLCIFLALAKREASDNAVVILDDVLTSADGDHLDRVIDLMHENAIQFGHVIITTHYRPWQERYRHHRAPGGQVHFVELRSWDLTTGIRVRASRHDLDELRQALDPERFDRQAVASKAGIFLENMLDFLARTYECPVRLTAHVNPTLRDLADGLPGKLVKALRVERDETENSGGVVRVQKRDVPLEPQVTRIKGLAILRNLVGAHFNPRGAEVFDKEIEELGQAALALGEALICPEGGDLPDRDKDGACWQSRSGKVRLYPHGMPA